jgi:hypothetical protein
LVIYGNSYWRLRPIQAGVSQGSLLGPTLFIIYINDIPSVQNDPNISISAYADDTIISVRAGSIDIAVRKLNAAVALLEPLFRKWRIKINTQICAITLFSRWLRHYRRRPCPVMIFDENIAWTSETNFLGVTFVSKISYKTYISCILQEAKNRLRQLYPILNKSYTIDINLALIVYKSLIRSILTYASPVWAYAAKTHLNELQTFQNKVLRIIRITEGNDNSNITWTVWMPLFRRNFRNLARAVYRKSANSDNSEIKGLGHYESTGDTNLRPLSLLASKFTL